MVLAVGGRWGWVRCTTARVILKKQRATKILKHRGAQGHKPYKSVFLRQDFEVIHMYLDVPA